jgi:hypothetical protein
MPGNRVRVAGGDRRDSLVMPKIDASASAAEKARWRLVDLGTGNDIEGGATIVYADEDTGEFVILVPEIAEGHFVVVDGKIQCKPKSFTRSPGSFRIVGRRR